MSPYPFSSTRTVCDPAVDHAAAAAAAFSAGDDAAVIQHCFCAFHTAPVDLGLHALCFQAMVRCGLHSTSTFSEAVLDTLCNDAWETIAEAARARLAANPLDEGAAAILARITYLIAPPTERTALIQTLRSIHPQSALLSLLLATEAASLHHDAAAASRHLEDAQALANDDPEFLCWVADLYAFLGVLRDLPRAVTLYDESLWLNPDLAAAWFGRAMAQKELGDWAAAQDDIHHALQLTPFDYRLLNARAMLYEAQHDDAAALEDFQRVLAINPSSYSALRGVAELGTRLNRPADRKAATQAFLSSHTLQPTEPKLTAHAPVRFHLSGATAAVIRSTLSAGQQATFFIEPADEDNVFAAALLVAPDGGAVTFASRTFNDGPVIQVPVKAAAAGDYTLFVLFNGIGEQEIAVRMQ